MCRVIVEQTNIWIFLEGHQQHSLHSLLLSKSHILQKTINFGGEMSDPAWEPNYDEAEP